MEDVATAAGVGVATAYNHFSSKHALIGHVYRPIIIRELEYARSLMNPYFGSIAALMLLIESLSEVAHQEIGLTTSLLAAVFEQTIKAGGPPHVSADDAANYHKNGLMLRVMTRPDESWIDIAGLVTDQILPALRVSDT